MKKELVLVEKGGYGGENLGRLLSLEYFRERQSKLQVTSFRERIGQL